MGGGTAQNAQPAAHIQPAIERLQQGLLSKDGDIQSRAIRELRLRARTSVPAQQALVAFLFSDRSSGSAGMSWETTQALATADAATVVPMLLDKYSSQRSTSRLTQECMLIIIGRIGRPAAKAATPFLLAMSNDADPVTAALAEVALSTMGHHRTGAEEAILAALKRGGEDRDSVLFVMATTWSGQWISETMMAYLASLVRDNADGAMGAVGVLASAGERANKLAGTLKSIATDEECLVVHIAVAEIEQSEQALEQLLLIAPAHGGGHEMLPLSLVMKPELLRSIGERLHDRDPRIVAGAISVLIWAGTPCVSLGTDLLEIVGSPAADELRTDAAEALAMLGDVSQLSAIEAHRDRERSIDVREELDRAIRIIMLHEE